MEESTIFFPREVIVHLLSSTMLKDGKTPEIKQSKYSVDTKYTFP